MAPRIVDGPEITGQVTHKQTGQAYGPVAVTVSPKVYTDREMTASVTSLTTDGTGVFSCYAPPGTYTFTTSAVDSAPIESVEVLGREGGTGVSTAASGAYWDSTSNATSLPLPRIIDVRDYGAKFDNSTDDTVAIQAAITAAQRNLYSRTNQQDFVGSIVQMPPGSTRVSQLKVPSNVWLRGAGPSSTYIQGTDITKDIIVNNASSDVQITLSDFGVFGPTSHGSGLYGINLSTSGTANVLGDQRHIIRDIVIVGSWGGWAVIGGTEVRVTRVTVQRPIAKGCQVTATDCFISDCTVGQPGNDNAFDIQGANTRMWGCKAYGGTFNQPHFNIAGAGRHEIVACESQDGGGDGFSVHGNDISTLVGCLVDSCTQDCFPFGAASVLKGCVAGKRSGGAHTPRALLNNQSNVGGSVQLMFIVGGGAVPVFNTFTGNTLSNLQGDLNIQFGRGTQNVAYAATVTPSYYLGGHHRVASVTGNLTIANPATTYGAYYPLDARLRFTMPVDATGGYTLAFGTAYKLVGAAAPALGANSVVTIEFSWDGTNWRETGRAIT